MAGARITRILAAAAMAAGAVLPAIAAVPTPAMAPVSGGVELIMIDRRDCPDCARWKAEVMPRYAMTAPGRVAPLRVVQLDGPWPDGLILGARPAAMPAFILTRNGQEVSRMEGCPGGRGAFFWPMLARMLSDAGIPAAR